MISRASSPSSDEGLSPSSSHHLLLGGSENKKTSSFEDNAFPASQLDTQNTQSSDDAQPPTGRLDTCTSVETSSRSMSPLRQEIRRLAAPLSKEQLIEIIASAAAVSPSVHKLVQATAIASPAARRIMVRNIHYNTTDAGFIAHFAQFGPLEDAAIVREKFGRSKGFGFVTFKNIESMHKCINSPLHLDGRKLFVKVAADPFSEFLSDGAPIQGRMTRRKIFVRNLPPNCNVEELREAFSQYGPIEDCAVVSDGRGRTKGFAFITFVTQEGAVKASAEPQQTFAGRVIFVSIAKSCTRQPTRSKPPSPMLKSQHAFGVKCGGRSNVLYDPWSEAATENCFLDLISGGPAGLADLSGNCFRGDAPSSHASGAGLDVAGLVGGGFGGLVAAASDQLNAGSMNDNSLLSQYGCLYPYSAAAAAAAFNLIAAQTPPSQSKASHS
eukprot:Blabericola_migrator_1__4919@NODE_2567_length_2597_cov_4_680632_g1605_i0_p1_GENE_NODE_2567_length_2597_cov_4_680632_g1605_i0NODE_2567_length_2597_cov_4_680632_g1605_i0_p1_ORF_typecomplete_len440_score63_00RRM_1/PF00076_22/6_3e14RRM_1/PF00076_22/3_4e18RRM_7/PF16367_5/0_04RRM_7/PF16367_5/1_3e05Nup35_RRM_2/PF14605_6/0_88Nup35_RRM_2/PF14605_6/0_0039RRM_5/PF13893_6/0_7RRM_5/PF13893_6/0_0099RRM_occluded/PF16842_5/8e02RRM_occluded/PF16842_5/0_0019PHM7_cyt/PF14703_6/1_1e03PHM7_cyt/PF14703_6/11PHM7_cyt/P